MIVDISKHTDKICLDKFAYNCYPNFCKECNEKFVAVAGGFDPLHWGHINHFNEAIIKCNARLVVLVSNTQDMIRKKGYEFIPFKERLKILDSLHVVNYVIPTIDKDGTQAITLSKLKLHYFAKGGDRTPDNMPLNELEACMKNNIKVVYNCGEQLQSSRELCKKILKK